MLKKIVFAALIFSLLIYSAEYIVDHDQESLELKRDIAEEGDYLQLADGFTYFNYKRKSNKPIILLIHGGGFTGSKIWKKNIPELLQADFSILQYDLYGRGYSERIKTEYSAELFQRQLIQLLENLQIGQPIHIIAQSMGCSIAIDFAEAYPDKVKKLVLIAPAIQGNQNDRKILHIPVISALLMTFYWYPQSIDNQMKEFYDPSAHTEYKEDLQNFSSFRGYKEINLSTWQNFLLEDFTMDYAKLNHEKLIIIGANDPYIKEPAINRLKKYGQNFNLISLPQAGHFPNIEQSERVNKKIINFLERKKKTYEK